MKNIFFCEVIDTLFSKQLFSEIFQEIWSSCEVKLVHAYSGAAAQECSIKKVFLEISQNSQENTCARASFLLSCRACNFIKKETGKSAFLLNLRKF